MHNFKFVDDKTLALSFSGDSNNTFQEALDIEVEETNKDKMIINEKNVIKSPLISASIIPHHKTLNLMEKS